MKSPSLFPANTNPDAVDITPAMVGVSFLHGRRGCNSCCNVEKTHFPSFEEGWPRRSNGWLVTARNWRGRGGQTPTPTERILLRNEGMVKRDRNLLNTPPLKSRRRELRNNPTPAETSLWLHLQRRQVLGKRFRRQYSIGRYIVDFFCVECDIAIELDGAAHFGELGAEYDAERTAFLERQGIQIIRFENRIVHQNIEAVLETIREAIQNRGV
jgi:very-short-patch-repair endonuclease